ncbi:glycoside hydrolase family 5 protein [Lentithecium fluviatile CBS 122367]|uniref:mannan endo-1,4-beta-mannosidase n=1 Tax=Lentithecium fluviatile CBS 122367 TaxID=1168545 RepID=A0A6G1JB83_9PLEO|nr:glycoside hydrolase family 5 protein [Lentithecium fluviatile CBS 122367]
MRTSIASVSLAFLLLGVDALPGAGKHHAVDPKDFIKVDGLRLKDSKGLHYLTGLNYWACMNLAASPSQGGNLSRLLTELDQMAAKGVNHLRIMASSEGAPTPQPFRMAPALMDAPGKYNEEVFKGLDVCLDEMSKRGMRATMTLNDEWQWSGGFAQYINWATNRTIPYPPSWNMTKAPQRAIPGTGWGDYSSTADGAHTYDEFTNFANEIYTNEQAEAWYKDHIRTVMSRTNTVNGRKYNEDATIMTWQLANEPQVAGAGDESDTLYPWIERISGYIRSLTASQLISVGLESKQGEDVFKRVHSIANVSYSTAHLWVQNWGIYDMYDSSAEGLATAQAYARAFVANTSAWARDVGKPVFLEEFGMARDNWENKDKEYPYLSSANTTHKDAYFGTIIGAVVADFKAGGAYVGTCPWAYGGIWRPETQHMNEFGMVWAGDPPHESPGWYDLYDTDKAMDIVADQQKNVAKWLNKHGGY